MILGRIALAFLLGAPPEPTVTPTPQGIRGHIIRPGWAVDPATGEYRPLPTPTRLPRPGPQIIRPCARLPGHEGSAGYRDCDIEVVIGTVRDVDPAANHGPMLVLDVEEAFPADPGTTLAVSLALRGSPPWDGEPVAKGDRILIALVRDPGNDWACGRLRQCDGPPPAINWIGVEVFRPANWPS
jgi:hypothetical protein